MPLRFERRIKMLECSTHRAQTAADIIATLRKRPPRNADEFVIWERNLSDAERAAYQPIADAELALWREQQRC